MMLLGGYVMLIPWALVLLISVVSSRTSQNTSCSREMEGQPVDGPCGQLCICLNGTMQYCCRQRKNFQSMTRSERLRYVNTVIKASTGARYETQYNTTIATHRLFFFEGIHRKPQFLPWHRWFVLLYENLLRTIDCRVTVPYWDWSLFSGAAWRNGEDDIWSNKPWGLGGNGSAQREGCVQDGRFGESKWNVTPSAGEGCLWRNFSDKPPDIIAVHLTKEYASDPRKFHDFEFKLRLLLHDEVHVRIGGTMRYPNSANAPEFFLHHAFVDKIWADWQEKSTSHLYAYFKNQPDDLRMSATQYRPKDFMDTLNMPHPNNGSSDEDRVCVVYQDPVHPLYNEIMQRLESLTIKEIESVPRCPFLPATPRELQKLGAPKEEIGKAMKMVKETLEPKKPLQYKQLRKIYDQMLGFRLRDLPFRSSAVNKPTSKSLRYDRWLAKASNTAGFHTKYFKTPGFQNISGTFV